MLGGKPVCEGTFSKYPDYKYADHNGTFTDEEVEAVVEAVKRGYLCTDRGGIKVPEFEEIGVSRVRSFSFEVELLLFDDVL